MFGVILCLFSQAISSSCAYWGWFWQESFSFHLIIPWKWCLWNLNFIYNSWSVWDYIRIQYHHILYSINFLLSVLIYNIINFHILVERKIKYLYWNYLSTNFVSFCFIEIGSWNDDLFYRNMNSFCFIYCFKNKIIDQIYIINVIIFGKLFQTSPYRKK